MFIIMFVVRSSSKHCFIGDCFNLTPFLKSPHLQAATMYVLISRTDAFNPKQKMAIIKQTEMNHELVGELKSLEELWATLQLLYNAQSKKWHKTWSPLQVLVLHRDTGNEDHWEVDTWEKFSCIQYLNSVEKLWTPMGEGEATAEVADGNRVQPSVAQSDRFTLPHWWANPDGTTRLDSVVPNSVSVIWSSQ